MPQAAPCRQVARFPASPIGLLTKRFRFVVPDLAMSELFVPLGPCSLHGNAPRGGMAGLPDRVDPGACVGGGNSELTL